MAVTISTNGKSAYPTIQQIEELKRRMALVESEITIIDSQGEFTIAVPPNGVALLEVG
jgi:hypothetical protein